MNNKIEFDKMNTYLDWFYKARENPVPNMHYTELNNYIDKRVKYQNDCINYIIESEKVDINEAYRIFLTWMT